MSACSRAPWNHLAYAVPQFTLVFAVTLPIALLGALADDPALELDNSSINSALAVGSLTRALGKVVNGVTVDSFGVRRFLGVIMLAPALATMLLSTANKQASVYLVFGVLQFCASGAWLAGCKIIERRFRGVDPGPCFSLLATCSRLGSMSARLGLGALLAVLRWRQIALAAAPVLLGLWAFSVQVLLRDVDTTAECGSTPRVARQEGGRAVVPTLDHVKDGHVPIGVTGANSPLVRKCRLLQNRGLQLQACVNSGATCLMALENMCPLLLKDFTHLSNSEISVFATAFPAAALCGIAVTPQIDRRLTTAERKLGFELALQALAFVGVVLLGWLTSSHRGPGPAHPAALLAGLACVAFGVALNYYIKPGIHTLEFGDDCATASSILDAVGMLAAVGFQLAASKIFEHGGTWLHTMGVLALCPLLMSVCSVLMLLERAPRGGVRPPCAVRSWFCTRKARVALPLLTLSLMCALRITDKHMALSSDSWLRHWKGL